MNRLWYTDGLSRKRYEERKDTLPCLHMLEDDFPALMARTVEMMRHTRYFNPENQPDGCFYDLFRFQPLVILTEIWELDTSSLEKLFRQAYESGGGECKNLRMQLKIKLDGWDKRLSYCRYLRLTGDLRNRPAVSRNGEVSLETVKKEYYGLLEAARKLQQNYNLYLKEIEASGKNDPALAVVEVFLQNYRKIVGRFNARWADLPSLYFEKILHAGKRKSQPDSTWLVLKKSPGGKDVTVEKGTAFVAGKNADNTLFYYRSREDMTVGDIGIVRLCSYFLEKDQGRFPAARLNYVTAILKNEREPIVPEPQKLFGGEHSWHEPVGLLVESPMFVLREGCRSITLSFHLTQESAAFFSELVADVNNEEQLSDGEVVFKLLNDAFYLEISTGEGWEKIPDYVLTYEENSFFRLVFRLNGDFPATGSCQDDKHRWVSGMPVLRIMMNREAWLFPYSWAKRVRFDEMTLRAEVSDVSSLSIYNASGQLDLSVPACPFGAQPERGAWFVAGNYEMALKPLERIGLACRWQQLPDHPEGFYGYYRGYGAGIDNHSFKVRVEWLAGKKWLFDPINKVYLFMPPDGKPLFRDGRLPGNSHLMCRITGKMPVVVSDEEHYVYGRTRSGFIRVVLDEPETGFGHAAYRQIFIDTMMLNSRRKHPLPLPVVPVSPVIDDWALDYVAEEKICFAAGQAVGATKLYHICSLASADVFPAASDRPVALADGPWDCGNLLLGFRNAIGCERIRFFIDVTPLQQEMDVRDRLGSRKNSLQGTWYVSDNGRWMLLDVNAVLQDTTGFFMNSGVIDILLPEPITENRVDRDGIFWLCAAFSQEMVRLPAGLKGIYMNAVEVISDTGHIHEHPGSISGLPVGTISTPEKNLPGITDICQVTPGKGGRIGGDSADIRLRISDRIAHRGRAVLPADYERLVLEYFPQVMKVKCLPGLDSKALNRPGVVTLVVVLRPVGDGWPLADGQLLSEIEGLLQSWAGEFSCVDAINPMYEEMTVRYRVLLDQGTFQGETVRRLEKKLNDCIAPWMGKDGIPLFGYRFSLRSLQNAIMEDAGVTILQGLSVLHITEAGERLYRLDEYDVRGAGEIMIGASQPWCVAVPASGHLVETGREGEWKGQSGVGELEIGNTLVIG